MQRSARMSAGGSARILLATGLALGCLGPAAAPALAAAGPLSIPLPEPLPPIRVLTPLVGLHLLGLCFGLGGATMLDFWILRWMRWGGLAPEIARMFLFVSKVVTVGLALLWISGLGFLVIYAFESPEKLANPKIWAKVTIVVVLTVNGLLIHALVLPGVLRDIGRPMLQGVSGLRTGIFLVSGAVSGVSWYAAFALGLMRELNGRVTAGALLGLWFAAVAAAAIGAYLFWLHLREWKLRQIGTAPSPAAPVLRPPAARQDLREDTGRDREPMPRAASAAVAARIPTDRILVLHPPSLRGEAPVRLLG